jgi:hypothetical protein
MDSIAGEWNFATLFIMPKRIGHNGGFQFTQH